MPLRVRRPWVEDWSWDLRLRRRSCCSGGLLRPLCCCCGRGEGGKGDECGRTVGRYCCCLAYYRVLFACYKSLTLIHSILLAESQCKPSYLFGYTYYTGTIPSQPPTFHHDVPTIVEHHHLLGIYPTTSTMYARIHITSKYSNTPSIHPSTRHSTTDPTSHH